MTFIALEQWLDEATRGLCPEAQERIREEIGQHVESAIADIRAEGVDQVAAERAAVELLGSARKARRGFRRMYLTQREANIIAADMRSLDISRKKRVMWSVVSAVVCFALWQFEWAAFFPLLVFLAADLAECWMPADSTRWKFAARASLDVCTWLTLAWLLLALDPTSPEVAVGFICFAGYRLWSRTRIWLKLRRLDISQFVIK